MSLKKLFFSKNPLYDKCPSCSEIATLHRSRSRNGFETFVKNFTHFNIYRCKTCGWRGYRSSFSITKTTIKTLLIYAGLMLVTAFIVRYVLTKFIK